jgi:hypothetical protein
MSTTAARKINLEFCLFQETYPKDAVGYALILCFYNNVKPSIGIAMVDILRASIMQFFSRNPSQPELTQSPPVACL